MGLRLLLRDAATTGSDPARVARTSNIERPTLNIEVKK
jgi:hypothetical protein